MTSRSTESRESVSPGQEEPSIMDGDRHILQLTSNNYQRWKFEVSAILESKEVLDVVNGTLKLPDDTKVLEVKDWKKKDALARTILSKSLDDDHHNFIRSCLTSKDMWSTIVSLKEQATVSTKLLANQEFHSFKWESGMSVSSFLSQLNVIAGKLESLDAKQDESSLIGKVIHCLPQEFDSFRQSWRLTSTGDSTFTKLQSELLAAEADMKARDPLASATGDAFYGKGSSRGQGQTGTRSFGGGKKKSGKEVICYSCQKPGHMKRDCPKLKLKKKEQKKKQKSDSEEEDKASGYVSAMSAYSINLEDGWIADSGAFAHITSRREWFSSFREVVGKPIKVGGGRLVHSVGVGTIKVQGFNGKVWKEQVLNNVQYVPNFGSANLFSLGAASKKGFECSLDNKGIKLERKGRIHLVGKIMSNNLYQLALKVDPVHHALVVKPDSLKLWHERFGHVDTKKIKLMARKDLVDGLNVQEGSSGDFFCKGCTLGAMSRRSHPSAKEKRSCLPGEFIHSDVCGPFSTESVGGSRYYVCFKDEACGYRHVYCIKEKSLVLDKFKEFKALVEIETGRKVKLLRSDNGTEFKNSSFASFLREHGIVQEFSPAYTPQSNGMAERENRTLVEKASSMLHSRGLPRRLWAEAIVTAAYLLNRVPCRRETEATPYSEWFGHKPDVSNLRIFGSECYVHVSSDQRKKMDPKSKVGIFVGYGRSSKLFRVFDQARNKLDMVTNVKFNEEVICSRGLLLEDDDVQVPTDGEVQDSDGTEEVIDSDSGEDVFVTPQRQPVKVEPPSAPKRGRPVGSKNKPKPPPIPLTMDLRERSVTNCVYHVTEDPLSVDDAISREDGNLWIEAMEQEMDSLEENEVFDLVQPPKNRPVVKNRWIFKTKLNPDGTLDKRKARLVAKGFTQRKGVDYGETYSPVVRFESVRMFLSIVAAENLELVQFDVKTAFLHGDLDEDIYMEQPEFFNDGSGNVWKLLKGLYGLKQSPRCWNHKIDLFLESYGLRQLDADKCIYSSRSGPRIILALYVDDGLLACESKEVMKDLLVELDSRFKITTGHPNCFVGLELIRDREKGTISLHQSNYIRRMLERYRMSDCKPAKSPGDPKNKLTKDQCPKAEEERKLMSTKPYREAVGSLMFLMVCSRPDIAFEVSRVAKFCDDPGSEHWTAVKRIFRYLQGTKNLSISYGKIASHPFSTWNNCQPFAFCDSDWAGELDSRHSTYGYVFLVNGGPVTWTSKVQKSVAASVTEAEYVSLSETSRESIWIKKLVSELGYEPTAIEVRCDNQGAICLSKNPELHQRTKHIDIRYHFVREQVSNEVIQVLYTPTSEQPADMLTKSLSGPSLVNCLRMLNMDCF